MNSLLRIPLQLVEREKRKRMEEITGLNLSYLGIKPHNGNSYMSFAGEGRLFLEDCETALCYEARKNKRNPNAIVLERIGKGN